MKKENDLIDMENDFFSIFDLPWDTEFFGIKCCKINLKKEIQENIFKQLLEGLDQYNFISINNENNNSQNNQLIGKCTNAFLVDVNIQFEKNFFRGISYNNIAKNINVIIQNNFPTNIEILKLAKKSYVHSKFISDNNLKKRNGSLVYYHWTKNSFFKNDKYFLAFESEKKIGGYILFSLENKNICRIELIAVDESRRREYIGQIMLQNLEKYLLDLEITQIKVGTQIENLSAANFYIHNNFKIKNIKSTYHFWR